MTYIVLFVSCITPAAIILVILDNAVRQIYLKLVKE